VIAVIFVYAIVLSIQPMPIRKVVEAALQSSRFGVLATEGYGQPHASLIAISPVESCRQLVFATYRSTRKFRNLTHTRMAVMENGCWVKKIAKKKLCPLCLFMA
jgi:hypothetical protein